MKLIHGKTRSKKSRDTVPLKAKFLFVNSNPKNMFRYEGDWEKGLRHGRGKYVR
jgi:hypothetical protein